MKVLNLSRKIFHNPKMVKNETLQSEGIMIIFLFGTSKRKSNIKMLYSRKPQCYDLAYNKHLQIKMKNKILKKYVFTKLEPSCCNFFSL